jgi:DNA-binding CsgD family transcriptional regulator
LEWHGPDRSKSNNFTVLIVNRMVEGSTCKGFNMSQALPPTKVSELIGHIYDSAIDPSHWSYTLAQLIESLNFTTAAFSVRTFPDGKNLLTYTAGVAPHWLAQAKQYDHEVPVLWGGVEKYHSLPIDGVHLSTEHSTEGEREKLAFIRDWARPQGLIDKVALILARNSRSMGRLALGRHELQGPVGDVDINNCLLLLPHLQRAVAISQLLDAKTLAVASFEASFDAIATPVVIVGHQLEIIHSNISAKNLLPNSMKNSQTHNKLNLNNPVAQQALDTAVNQSAKSEASMGRRGFGIPITDANGNPMVVHVLPLRFGTLRPQLIAKAAAVIFFATPTTSPEAPQEALAALYDLTHTEAKVMTLVAAGHSRNEIADKLCVGLSTIKTHLLHLNSKTGAARQSELAKLARSLSVPI